MPQALVSICIPTYNGAAYLAEALQSAIGQTYPHLEIVVSDDASTDATLEIVESFKHKTQIPIHIVHHTPSGIGANWNHCMQKAQGEYIKFLFQDDVLMPDCVEKMVAAAEQHPQAGMIASKRTFLKDSSVDNLEMEIWIKVFGNLQSQLFKDKNLNHYWVTKALFKSVFFRLSPLNKIGEPSVTLIKSAVVKKIGTFRTDLKQVLDYEYWYRLLKKYPILILDEELVKFRLHSNQATQINKKQSIDDYEIFEKILYKNYLWLLHPKERKKLLKKFSPAVKFLLKLKRRFT